MTLPRPRHALTALTLTLTLTGCVSPSFMTSKEGTMDDPRYAQLLDLIGEALKDDMAVVLVADIMPHASLKDALTMTQWTPTVIWMHEKEPRVTFSRKFQTNSLKRDPKETYLFGAFEVHILPPGKYLLTGGDDYKLNALLDQVGAAGRSDRAGALTAPRICRPSCIASSTGKPRGATPPRIPRPRRARSAPPCTRPRAPA